MDVFLIDIYLTYNLKTMEQLTIDDLINLKKHHLAEYNKYSALLEKTKEAVKTTVHLRKASTTEKLMSKRRHDCDEVIKILQRENRSLGTGELCTFLNERLDYTRIYNSTEFSNILGKYLKQDERIKNTIGKIKGKRTTIWEIVKQIK